MQSVTPSTLPYTIESAGVDWITATANTGSTQWELAEYTRHERERLLDADVELKHKVKLGYKGWGCEGFFYGTRDDGSIVIASGALAHRVFRSVVNCTDHISRLDLQTTVSFEKERPHLALQAYSAIKTGSPGTRRVRNATLFTSHPQGETLNLGKRSSDHYARLYDKATESGQGEPLSRWRYEVEIKRTPANLAALELVRSESPEGVAGRYVWEHFNALGVTPIYVSAELLCPHKPTRNDFSRDVLSWFEDSLRITVAKAVRRYGAARVIESLGLTGAVDVRPERSEDHGTRTRRLT